MTCQTVSDLQERQLINLGRRLTSRGCIELDLVDWELLFKLGKDIPFGIPIHVSLIMRCNWQISFAFWSQQNLPKTNLFSTSKMGGVWKPTKNPFGATKAYFRGTLHPSFWGHNGKTFRIADNAVEHRWIGSCPRSFFSRKKTVQMKSL